MEMRVSKKANIFDHIQFIGFQNVSRFNAFLGLDPTPLCRQSGFCDKLMEDLENMAIKAGWKSRNPNYDLAYGDYIG